MSQIDRHLTTEQLSTLLDTQRYKIPTDGQLDSVQAHLDSCEQCQHAFADLRQTVNLLRSLPQPALPRSFTLPADFSLTQIDAEDEFEIPALFEDEASARVQPITSEKAHQRHGQRRAKTKIAVLPQSLRSTMRTISALAAMIGICLALSGLLSSLGHDGAAFSTSSSIGSPAETSDSSSKDNSSVTPETAGTSIKNQSHAAGGRVTPTSTAIPSLQPAAPNSPEISSPPYILPSILFFDLNTPAGRLGLGILLAIFGSIGFTLFKQRYRTKTNHGV